MSPIEQRYAEADSMAEYAAQIAPILHKFPCNRAPLTMTHVNVSAMEDFRLNAHLAAVDALEANEEAARRNVGDKHVSEAVEMVQENIQNQIDAGQMSVYDAALLTRVFERIEEVAIECSWADLAKERQA